MRFYELEDTIDANGKAIGNHAGAERKLNRKEDGLEMKLSEEMIAALEKCGVSVSFHDGTMCITYYTKYGGEENEEIPSSELDDESVAGWRRSAYDNYDVSHETYIWLDNTGHGMNGAPSEMEDVFADKKEWESKMLELADAADRVAFGD